MLLLFLMRCFGHMQQMKSRGVDATSYRGSYKLPNVAVQMRVGSFGSVSSGMSSSDSEPDCDSYP